MNYNNIISAEALSALDWWMGAGVDTIVGEEGRDWLRPAEKPVFSTVEVGRAAAALPGDLTAFADWMAISPEIPCPTTSRIAPSGDPASGVMLLADMPESGDASAGMLLAGEPGRLLDRMLGAIGRDRASVYIAPLSPARPADGRIEPGDLNELGRIARHHVALAAPRLLLILGDAASTALLGAGFVATRGKIHRPDLDGAAPAVVTTIPPRFLLDHPAHKQHAWADLRIALGVLEA